jgi:hypothetical protein
MKRGGYLHRRTPLRRVSPRRLSEKAARAAVIEAVLLRDGPGCYAFRQISYRHETAVACGWPLTCAHPNGKQLDAHEVIPRSVWPGGHLVISNVRMVCRRHHEWIDAHEITASTLGLHGFSWERST